MNKNAFAELTASIKEAGEIKRGKAIPTMDSMVVIKQI